ncbi:MAG: phospholipid carrier-dependent glycosyltransferase [Ignavibacteria bacterium]|jgi:hypothetical protein|nr:phospholipid carrier-dependent glycosyltransferase [Ignavibacteria bacterium]
MKQKNKEKNTKQSATTTKKVVKQDSYKKIATSKPLFWIGLAIISIVYIFVYTSIFDYKIDMNGDNIIYYSLGSAIADGKGYVNVFDWNESPSNMFTPGYPFIIAVAVTFGAKVVGLKVLNGIFLYLSLLVCYTLFNKVTKDVFISFVTVLLCSMNESLYARATIMMSEIPYLFFSMLALLIFYIYYEKIQQQPDEAIPPEQRRQWYINRGIWLLLLGVTIVSAYYIRTIGVTLLLALALTFIIYIITNLIKIKPFDMKVQVNANKFLVITIIACAAIFLLAKAPWDARNERQNLKGYYLDQALYQGTGGKELDGIGDNLLKVKKNFVTYLCRIYPLGLYVEPVEFDNYKIAPNTRQWTLGIIIVSLIVIGFFSIKKKDIILIFAMGGNILVFLMWPETYNIGTRYLIPIIPLSLLFSILGVVRIFDLIGRVVKIKTGWKNLLAVLLVLFMCIPNYSAAIKKSTAFSQHTEWNSQIAKKEFCDFIDAMKWTNANTPANSRVSCRKPEIFYIYSDKRKSISFPYYATEEEVFQFLDSNKINYIILDSWYKHAMTTIAPVVNAHLDLFEVLNKFGDDNSAAYVVRYKPVPMPK